MEFGYVDPENYSHYNLDILTLVGDKEADIAKGIKIIILTCYGT